MERRRFLELGALAGASATSQACAPSLHESTVPTEGGDFELRRRLRWLDRMMGSVEHVFPRLFHDHEPRELSTHEHADAQLTQSTFRSLLLMGSIGDLPEQERRHPEVTARLGHAAPEADYALLGMMARLSMMPADEHDTIQHALRDDPGIVDQIGDWMDQDARDLGVPLRRRLHLRKLLRHVGWRLRRQSLSTIVDEYASKVERIARAGSEGSTPELAAHTSQAEIERWSQQLAHLVSLYEPSPASSELDEPTTPEPDATTTEPETELETEPETDELNPFLNVNASATPLTPSPPETPETPEIPERSTRELAALQRENKIASARRTIKTGGITTGVGAGIALVSGLILLGIPIVGAIGLTVAAIALIAGLVILSVGAVRLRRAKQST